MPDLLGVVTLKGVTGLPRDRFVNTFALAAPGIDTDAERAAVADELAGFYNSGASNTENISTHIGPQALRTAGGMVVSLYDITGHLDGSPHGSPVYTSDRTLTNTGGTTGLPSEMAAVVTLRGILASSQQIETPDNGDADDKVQRPRQRHSGRLYVGPLNTSTITMVSGVPRLSSTLRQALAFSANRLRDNLDVLGVNWCVWSRTDQILRTITSVEVDDAFDVQRRRGEAASVRTATSLV